MDFIRLYLFNVLTTDIMFVNGIPFLPTHSWGINLLTIDSIFSCTVKHLSWHIQHALSLYSYASFVTRTILMDMKFGKVKDELPAHP